jgi:hypothetical protein
VDDARGHGYDLRDLGAWLAENPDDPDAPGIRSRYEGNKRTHLRHRRDVLGWAIFVGWKRP